MKKLLSVLLVLVLLVSLCGCSLQYNIGAKWNMFGKGEIQFAIAMDERLYQAYNYYYDKTLDTLIIDGDNYYGKRETIQFNNTKELASILTLADGKEITIGETKMESPILKSASITPFKFEGVTNSGVFYFEGYNLEGIELNETLSITFPTKVTKANGMLSPDRKTVTWEIDGSEVELIAQCRNPWIFIYFCPLIVIAIVVLGSVLKKKKSKAAAPAVQDADAPAAPAVQDADAPAAAQDADAPAAAPAAQDATEIDLEEKK